MNAFHTAVIVDSTVDARDNDVSMDAPKTTTTITLMSDEVIRLVADWFTATPAVPESVRRSLRVLMFDTYDNKKASHEVIARTAESIYALCESDPRLHHLLSLLCARRSTGVELIKTQLSCIREALRHWVEVNAVDQNAPWRAVPFTPPKLRQSDPEYEVYASPHSKW